MRAKNSQAGLTLVEVLVVLLVIFLFAAMILPAMSGPPGPKARIHCISHLRIVGFSYQLWAEDHGGRFPAATPISDGGWQELLTNDNVGRYCWTNYAVMWPYLKPGNLVKCSVDTRKSATNLVCKGSPYDKGNADFKGNCNVSYFVGVTASLKYPRSILGGDRNLSAGSKPRRDFGFSPADDSGNDVVIRTKQNSAYCWSSKMHSRGKQSGDGNLLYADGTVGEVIGSRLGECFAKVGVPRSEGVTNVPAQTSPSGAGFRLVFP